MLRSHTRFYTSGGALRDSWSWSLFRDFGRENFTVMPKIRCVIVHHCQGVSPTKQNKNTKVWKPNRINERARGCFQRETKLWPGNEISALKDVTGPIGSEIDIRRTRASREVLSAKMGVPLPRTDSALATRGLHGNGAMSACVRPEPVDVKIDCAIVHH